MAPLQAGKISVGDVFEEIVVDNLTRTQIVMFAGASGDFHPCHSDGPFVQGIGPNGLERFPLFRLGSAGTTLVEIDFRP